MKIYDMSDENRPSHLNEFLAADMPMCEKHKKHGLVRVSYYLDHIKRIRAGGHKTDEKNLQWLCPKCDRAKRIKESNE